MRSSSGLVTIVVMTLFCYGRGDVNAICSRQEVADDVISAQDIRSFEDYPGIQFVKRNAKAFSLNAIVDVRPHRLCFRVSLNKKYVAYTISSLQIKFQYTRRPVKTRCKF